MFSRTNSGLPATLLFQDNRAPAPTWAASSRFSEPNPRESAPEAVPSALRSAGVLRPATSALRLPAPAVPSRPPSEARAGQHALQHSVPARGAAPTLDRWSLGEGVVVAHPRAGLTPGCAAEPSVPLVSAPRSTAGEFAPRAPRLAGAPAHAQLSPAPAVAQLLVVSLLVGTLLLLVDTLVSQQPDAYGTLALSLAGRLVLGIGMLLPRLGAVLPAGLEQTWLYCGALVLGGVQLVVLGWLWKRWRAGEAREERPTALSPLLIFSLSLAVLFFLFWLYTWSAVARQVSTPALLLGLVPLLLAEGLMLVEEAGSRLGRQQTVLPVGAGVPRGHAQTSSRKGGKR